MLIYSAVSLLENYTRRRSTPQSAATKFWKSSWNCVNLRTAPRPKAPARGTWDYALNGYDEDKKQLYRENVMNEFKAKMTLLELTHDAREDGFAEGEAKGRAEGIAETARAMLADGLSVETVMKYTGLTAEQIAAL